MKTSVFTKGLTAALALSLGVIPTTALLAQNAGSRPGTIRLPPGAFNPAQARRNLQLAPSFAPAMSTPLSVGPASGPTGSQFQVRTNGRLGANPAMVVFEAEPYSAAPVRFTVFLQGCGTSFTTRVPQFLCYYGPRRWDIHVSLTNRQAFRNVGTFTPTNCRR